MNMEILNFNMILLIDCIKKLIVVVFTGNFVVNVL